ncbi:Gfo/Idh/MocA family protein [Naasia sp. SYSU D00948]|uniref:Gfo/Idh/MocA family protein n=1 Tax=Naasia sp. SYSU D00948 TaxID=2817379 RepID=UPI001B30E207|nr:Gfo/Idh/MocA family oxidoreductase [Naasia sp. SYSU D00948]
MIGAGFMGAVHSQAWSSVARFFPGPRPVLAVLGARNPESTRAAADRLGWREASTDWREIVARDDIDVVDIATPGDSHAEIAIAALEAGKHVICEKPLANTVEEAEAMTAAAVAARERGVRSMVAFNYRRVPAVALARQYLEEGRLGEIRHVRADYLQDWIADPDFPLVWRLQKERSGSGALGDIGAHVLDLAEHLSGQSIAEVSGTVRTFVERRPLAGASEGLSATAAEEYGEVTVDDAAAVHARLNGGAMGTVEATRFATGRKNAMRIEVNGSLGSIAFDFESMNELLYYDGRIPAADAGFRRILVTEPDHPYAGAWWPPGHGLGYEHAFVHEFADFLAAVADGRDPEPSFEHGLHIQRILDAVIRSAEDESRWTSVGAPVLTTIEGDAR